MTGRRRYKVRVRGKVRNQLLRRGGMAAGVTLGLLAAAWLGNAGLRAGRRLLDTRLQFRPEAFEVNCDSEEAAGTLRELAAAAVRRPFTGARAAELAREIRERHPGLASVKVSRNFLTRKATVTAVPEEAVAPVLADGATAYLGVSGRFMPERLAGGAGDAFEVRLEHAPGSAPALASFLAEFKSLAGLLYSPPARLACDCRGWDCRLSLADGTQVQWGEFEFTRLKILRLNEVMGDALAKSAGPLKADLRSFREGKIFVSAAGR